MARESCQVGDRYLGESQRARRGGLFDRLVLLVVAQRLIRVADGPAA